MLGARITSASATAGPVSPDTSRSSVVLDRRELSASKVNVVQCEKPTLVGGHAFTSGRIKRTGMEKVLPNTVVEFGIKDGVGCNASHFTEEERAGSMKQDEHIHEHATCYNLKDSGLVVITSCGHVGIVKLRRDAGPGAGKLHAIVGGFHLAVRRPITSSSP